MPELIQGIRDPFEVMLNKYTVISAMMCVLSG